MNDSAVALEQGTSLNYEQKPETGFLKYVETATTKIGELILNDIGSGFRRNQSLETPVPKSTGDNKAIFSLHRLLGINIDHEADVKTIVSHAGNNPKIKIGCEDLYHTVSSSFLKLAKSHNLLTNGSIRSPKELLILFFGKSDTNLKTIASALAIAPNVMNEIVKNIPHKELSNATIAPNQLISPDLFLATLIICGVLSTRRLGAGQNIGSPGGQVPNNMKKTLFVVVGILGCCAAAIFGNWLVDSVQKLPQNIKAAQTRQILTPAATITPLPTRSSEQIRQERYDSYKQGVDMNPISMIDTYTVIQLTIDEGPTWAFVPEREKFLEEVFGRDFTKENITEIRNTPILLINLLKSMKDQPNLSEKQKNRIQAAIDFYQLRIDDLNRFKQVYSPRSSNYSDGLNDRVSYLAANVRSDRFKQRIYTDKQRSRTSAYVRRNLKRV